MQVMAADLLVALPCVSTRSVTTLSALMCSNLVSARLRHRFITLLESAAPESAPAAILPPLLQLLTHSQEKDAAATHLAPEQRYTLPSALSDGAYHEHCTAHNDAWAARVDASKGAAAALCRLEQARTGVLATSRQWLHARVCGAHEPPAPGDAPFLACMGCLTLVEHACKLDLIVLQQAEDWSKLAAHAAVEYMVCWHSANERAHGGAPSTQGHASGDFMEWPPAGQLPQACPSPDWALRMALRLPTGCSGLVHCLAEKLSGIAAANDNAIRRAAVPPDERQSSGRQGLHAVAFCLASIVQTAQPEQLRSCSQGFECACIRMADAKVLGTISGAVLASSFAEKQAMLVARLRARTGLPL
jgi:hypothetical protein